MSVEKVGLYYNSYILHVPSVSDESKGLTQAEANGIYWETMS